MKRIIFLIFIAVMAVCSSHAQSFEYWINDKFTGSGTNYSTNSNYETSVKTISYSGGAKLERYYSNFETNSGCSDGNSKMLRVEGAEDHEAWVKITVPDAGKIRISLKAKSTSKNRSAEVLVNGVVRGTYTGLDINNCKTFEMEVNSSTQVIITVRGTDSNGTNPIGINSVQVTKYYKNEFKSSKTGNWNQTTTWLQLLNTEQRWAAAIATPSRDSKVTICEKHAVTNNVSISSTNKISSLEVEAGAALNITSGIYINNLLLNKKTSIASAIHNTSTMNVDNIKVNVAFENPDRWNFVSFPFGIKSIKKQNGSTAIYGTDYEMRYYDAGIRAQNSSGWAKYEGSILADNAYIIWAESTLVFEASTSGNVSGLFSNSSHTKPLTYTSAKHDCNAGWNFVVHPMFGAESRLTLETGQFYYKYIYGEDSYDVAGGDEAVICSHHTFDSYFIKIPQNNAGVDYSHYNNILRSVQETPDIEKLIVKLKGDSYDYKTQVRINDQATAGYDNLYDAPHMMSSLNTTPQIYSIIENDKIAINTLPGLSDVLLGVRVPKTGEYTIAWENELAVADAVLYDNLSGNENGVDMSVETQYTFTTTQTGEINNRFSIRFMEKNDPDPTGISQYNSDEKPTIYTHNRLITINGLTQGDIVKIQDISGRIIFTKQAGNESMYCNANSAGIYIITIINKNTQKNIKVLCD